MKFITYLFAFTLSIHAMATDPKLAYQLVLDKKAVIVDVREIEEIQSGMIDHAI